MPAPDRKAAKERVLEMAFEGRWTHAEIAERCQVPARTVRYWLKQPDMQARLEQMRSDLAESLRDVAYVHKTARIIGLSQMAEVARREFEARPWLKEVRTFGDSEITNESFNRDAHAAFRDALNDIAKELGERSSNVNITATSTQLGITVVLEQMRNDPRLYQAANDVLGLVAAATEAR